VGPILVLQEERGGRFHDDYRKNHQEIPRSLLLGGPNGAYLGWDASGKAGNFNFDKNLIQNISKQF